MIHEYEVKETVKHHKRTCDMCNVEIKRGMACSVARCEICGIDLCDKCVAHEDYSTGDYRTCYCSRCWNIGSQFRYKIKQHEDEVENLYEEWHSLCKLARQEAEPIS